MEVIIWMYNNGSLIWWWDYRGYYRIDWIMVYNGFIILWYYRIYYGIIEYNVCIIIECINSIIESFSLILLIHYLHSW